MPSKRKKENSSDSSDYEFEYSDSNSKVNWNVVSSDSETRWSYREYDSFEDENSVNEESDCDEWYGSLKTDFKKTSGKWMQKHIDECLRMRFECGKASGMEREGKVVLDSLKYNVFTNKEAMSKRIKDIYSNNEVQRAYVYRMRLHVKPDQLNIKGHNVGFKLDLMKLSRIMLKNKSLLQSVTNELKLVDVPFTEYNSEVTCDSERRNRLLGKLRFSIGIEEYELQKMNDALRKYYMFYVCFMNIPLEERFKRQDAYLFCVVSESKLRHQGLTVQDVLKNIADELKVMEQVGVDVEFQNEDDDLPQVINIKGALAAVCPTNTAIHEILGHRQPQPNVFNCHFCGATESNIQNIHNCLPLLGHAEADIKDYDQCVQAISDYEQKKNKDISDYEKRDIKKIVHSAKVYKNRFDVYRGCPLTALPGINLWDISPPNVVVDIADGVVGPLMTEFILVHAIKDLSGEEIATKISQFAFKTGKIEVKFVNGAFTLSETVRMTQKLELLSRFGKIFSGNLNLDHKGYKLLKTLQSFTKLALSFTIPLDDIPKLNLYALAFIQLCFDMSPSFKVFPKLHKLLHYSDLTQLYGPLINFVPLKNHKKELLFYNYHHILIRCTSVTKTHIYRRQMQTALKMNKQKYISVDLFANSNAQLKNGYEILLKFEVDRLKKIGQKKKNSSKEKGYYDDSDDDSEEEFIDDYDALDDYIG